MSDVDEHDAAGFFAKRWLPTLAAGLTDAVVCDGEMIGAAPLQVCCLPRALPVFVSG